VRTVNNVRADLEGLSPEYFTRKLRDKRFDGLVRRAIRDGKPLSQVDVDRITQRYAERSLAHRAEVIARTESLNALRAGRDEGVRQAMEQGAISNAQKVWDASGDSRVRPDHRAMNGQSVGMNEPFVAPDGSRLMYPGDSSLGASASQTVMCRCVTDYRVDWLRPGQVSTPPSTPAPAIVPALPQAMPRPTRISPPAVMPPPAAPSFAYQSYRGVKTVAEAEAYVTSNGIAETVSLKGLSPAGISQAIGAAHEVTERFNLNPLGYMGPITRDTRFRYRGVRGANAAVFARTQALHLPTKFGDLKEAQRQITQKNAASLMYERSRNAELQSRNVSDEVRSRIGMMQDGKYTWSITAQNPSAERAKTMYHEYGHVLHLIDRRIGPQIDAFLEQERPRQSGWDLLLSKYGNANDKEYIAEAFAVYMSQPRSEHFRIHPQLLAIFEREDRGRVN
jgi:hypothetical protein